MRYYGLISLLFSSWLWANSTVNVAQLDISGVRLGMPAEEALLVLKERYPADSIKDRRDSKIFRSLEVNHEGQRISIKLFDDALHQRPEALVVGEVVYSLKKEGENAANLKAAALEKYGEPSSRLSENSWQWCGEIEKVAGVMGCHFDKPYLSLDTLMAVTLVLKDRAYADAERKAQEQARSVKKPSI